MAKLLLASALVLHGLIHFMGPAKAFGYAALPQLTLPISPAMGVLWLLAGLCLLAAAGALFEWPRWWWVIGAAAIVLSQTAITASWTDAKFGSLANLVVFIGVVFGFLAQGPMSLRAAYEADVDRGLARSAPVQHVIEGDLAHLPAPVQSYLRASGVVGAPRVWNVRARMHGRIRSGPDAAWMPLTVRAVFTNAGKTIRAQLEFNEAGEMTNFWSDDRRQDAPDGQPMRRVPAVVNAVRTVPHLWINATFFARRSTLARTGRRLRVHPD